MSLAPGEPLRILAVSEAWQGSNAYAFVRAFRRAGHSTTILPENTFVPSNWRSLPLKVLRRILTPLAVREYSNALIEEARRLEPHLFFVFKGPFVEGRAVDAIRALGSVAVNFYPDVSFTTHGPYIPDALPRYDWVFTTKSFGITDMQRKLGITRASFLPHGYDAETHCPVPLGLRDHSKYDCDASFIGTWSPKKEEVLTKTFERLPNLRFRIWGAYWDAAPGALKNAVMGRGVHGVEYAKSICASAVNIAILSEVRSGASMGDQITSRTFHIPATGGFMLHERTDEVAQFFVEDAECAMFGDAVELAKKIAHYLAHPEERARVAKAGRRRCLLSGYSIDDRAAVVLAVVRDLLASKTARQMRS
jgi:spore maturation protein CgeB